MWHPYTRKNTLMPHHGRPVLRLLADHGKARRTFGKIRVETFADGTAVKPSARR